MMKIGLMEKKNGTGIEPCRDPSQLSIGFTYVVGELSCVLGTHACACVGACACAYRPAREQEKKSACASSV